MAQVWQYKISPSPSSDIVLPITLLPKIFSSGTTQNRCVQFDFPRAKSYLRLLPFCIYSQLLLSSLVFEKYTAVASFAMIWKKNARKRWLLHLKRRVGGRRAGVRGVQVRNDDGDGEELRCFSPSRNIGWFMLFKRAPVNASAELPSSATTSKCSTTRYCLSIYSVAP